MQQYILIYYAAVNVLALLLYGVDKAKAKTGAWRTPERTLLGIAFLGGAFGAFLGMQLFRHKTKHAQFVILVPLFCVLHAVLLFLLFHGKTI